MYLSFYKYYTRSYMSIGIVILHYMVLEDTVNCVESVIRNIDTTHYDIIIVDNGSQNDSGEQLEQLYQDNPKIHIIINSENLGFSGGNNIGYLYAKNVLNSTFIVLSNNDIELVSKNLYNVLIDDYKKMGFAVLGPHITNHVNGDINISPLRYCDIYPETYKTILRRQRISLWVGILFSYFGLDEYILRIKTKICMFLFRKKQEYESDKNKLCVNVAVHGCFIVFSPKYINKFNGLQEITFMYNEEWLLYDLCRRNRLLVIYDPRINVLHVGRRATKSTKSNRNSSMRKCYIRQLESANNVISYLDQIEVNNK